MEMRCEMLPVLELGTLRAEGTFECPMVDVRSDADGLPSLVVTEGRVCFALAFPDLECLRRFAEDAERVTRGELRLVEEQG